MLACVWDYLKLQKPLVQQMLNQGYEQVHLDYLVRTSGLLLAVGVPVLPTALQLIFKVEGDTSVSISYRQYVKSPTV